jgi:hypothetical protein
MKLKLVVTLALLTGSLVSTLSAVAAGGGGKGMAPHEAKGAEKELAVKEIVTPAAKATESTVSNVASDIKNIGNDQTAKVLDGLAADKIPTTKMISELLKEGDPGAKEVAAEIEKATSDCTSSACFSAGVENGIVNAGRDLTAVKEACE